MVRPLPVLVVFALLVAGGVVVYYATSRSPEVAPTETPKPVRAQKPPTPNAAAGKVLPIPKAEGLPPDSLLRFPNGTTAAPLNGVQKPALCVWGDEPWSPIVRREFNAGIDWYVHADGTYTTTMMLWRSDLQRDDPMTLCLHPTAPTSVEPSESGPGQKH